MTYLKRYRCLSCGEKFEAEVLESQEKEEYIRQGRPTGQVHCPKCNRTDVRPGRE